MYNSTFICTYQLIDEPDLSDDLYRCQFLQACNLKEWDGDTIHNIITYLETLIKHDTDFYQCLETNDMAKQFILLLAYPYFHMTHRCICDIIHHKKVSENHTKALLNEIHKNNN
jgi:hypothetical protein